ncbi:MAG: response regulator transcription factor, partial [Verrucomicrobiota bacterium]
SGTEAMDALKELSPEVMVLDVGLPDCNGLDLAKSILEAAPATKVVMLTMHDEPELFELAMDRGLSGYVLKEDAVSNLVNCLETVMAGKKFVSPSLAPLLVERFEMRKRLERDRPGLESLSPAERRVLKLISQNMTTKEIASSLSLSPRTIDNHRARICQKLDLRGVHALVKFAFEQKAAL